MNKIFNIFKGFYIDFKSFWKKENSIDLLLVGSWEMFE